MLKNNLKIFGMLVLLATSAAFSQVDETDRIERSMHFVDQSLKATELYNAGEAEKALAVFQELLAGDADLDEDGYVAISVGDCLAVLGRIKEARDAYRSIVTQHPDLEAKVNERLIELDLKDRVSDGLIDALKQQVQGDDRNRLANNLQLARALENRSVALLKESIAAFRDALAFGSPWLRHAMQNHIASLDELSDDLDLAIAQYEKRLDEVSGRKNLKKGDAGEKSPKIVIEKQQWRWNARVDKQPVVSFEIQMDKDGKTQILTDGQPVKLTSTQSLLLRRHEQRINQILLEAAGKLDNDR
jgi:tetratricopeptide (TPR) repeat protein